MSVYYSFHVGFGFLIDEDTTPLPEKWSNRDDWFSEAINTELSGSGVESAFCLNQMSGPSRWGFMATGTTHSMDRSSDLDLVHLQDPDPSSIANLWDIMNTCGVKTRIGWLMWVDVN